MLTSVVAALALAGMAKTTTPDYRGRHTRM
jgi:hypothetical protein